MECGKKCPVCDKGRGAIRNDMGYLAKGRGMRLSTEGASSFRPARKNTELTNIMKTNVIRLRQLGGGVVAALLISSQTAPADNLPASVAWGKVVNNQSIIPGTDAKPFNSYNQPSLNTAGYVVFRARSKGPQPVSGIYARNMLAAGETIRIADRSTKVPAPNNLASEFNEFPSIPRISMKSQTMATRGNSQPVWTYLVNGTDTRAGTNGIFLNPGGTLITGVGLLGAVPWTEASVLGVDYFPYMAVPGVSPVTRFDVFPGSPALAAGDLIVFKGNYTVAGEGKTGVFFRDPVSGDGVLPVQTIANSSTVIPNLPTGIAGVPFGSTAPPSAAGGLAVFAGFDNEGSPTYGGIYLAPLIPTPTLTTVVGIGDPVPGETNETFNRFGEALSFDGRYVAFWGAWGQETVTLWLDCPTDGNADVLAYCREFFGDNYPVTVPANQGIFVADTKTGVVHRVARTGEYNFADFVYWNFSGKPPGVGGSDEGDDGEPPRWRSTSFVAVSGGPNNTFMVAFKARSGAVDPVEHTYLNPVDGIYLADASSVVKLLDTNTDGQSLDPAAPAGSTISTLGIERESFRGSWLAITAGMVESVSEASMAGIYVSKIYSPVQLSGIRQGEYEVAPDSTEAKKSKSTSIDVKKNGKFSGSLVVAGTKYALSGTFNKSGEARQTIRTKSGGMLVRIVAAKVSGVRVLDVTATGGGVNYNKLAVYDD